MISCPVCSTYLKQMVKYQLNTNDTKSLVVFDCPSISKVGDKHYPHSYKLTIRPNSNNNEYSKYIERFEFYIKNNLNTKTYSLFTQYKLIAEQSYNEEVDYHEINVPVNKNSSGYYKTIKLSADKFCFDPKNPQSLIDKVNTFMLFV